MKNNKTGLVAVRHRGRVGLAVAPLLLGLVVAGCGGGGGGGVAPAEAPIGTAPTPVVPDPTPGVTPAPGTGTGTGVGQPPAQTPATPTVPGPTITGSARVGAWDPRIIAWGDGTQAVLPLHAALLADGRVMSYGTHTVGADGKFSFSFDVWTPPTAAEGNAADASRHMVLPTGIETHLFCSAQILIPTSGELLINGGDNWDVRGNTNTGNTAINIYSPTTNRMRNAGRMFEPRWYASVLTLPDGRTYTQGGTDGGVVYGGPPPVKAQTAEIRDPATGQSRQLTGFNTRDLENNYPRNYVGPDGLIYGWDHQILYRIDPYGAGVRTDLYKDDWSYGWAPTSTTVMFEPGRILVTGLGGWKDDGRTPQIIDLNGPTVTVSDAARMMQKRQWANATVLPDGKVVMMGGSENNAIADQVNWTIGRVAYEVEIYDPVANTWTVGPRQQRMRLYHSIALLLPNGTVLSAAGGWPGPQLNLDGEIYYPPYLFNADGSLAKRPTITAAPTVVDPTAELVLTSPDAANVSRITMVKTGSVTHSFNFEQRFIELGRNGSAAKPIVRDGQQLRVRLPANRFETPPGYYLVFVLDANGVPSEARTIRINPA